MFKCVQCFIEFWKDFHADQKWKFPELPPSQFKKRLELNRPGVDPSELERAKRFWRRRPSLILGEGGPGYLLVVFIPERPSGRLHSALPAGRGPGQCPERQAQNPLLAIC